MQFNSAIRERDRQDEYRLAVAQQNVNRRDSVDPLDQRLECLLGRLRVRGKITEDEYQAGVDWRELYFRYLVSIGAPHPFTQSTMGHGTVTDDPAFLPDEICENVAAKYKHGIKILEARGKRVLHAVNAIAVFDEPEELGDPEYTLKAARVGLVALAAGM